MKGDKSQRIWVTSKDENGKEMNSPLRATGEEGSLANTETLAHWDLCQTSNLQNSKLIRVCFLKALYLEKFSMVEIENECSIIIVLYN